MNIGFQRRTDLALAALNALAATRGRLSGAELARTIGTTITYLPQVVAPLIQAGWVGSERGPGGGYYLTDSAEDLSLLDVIEVTEGPAVDGRCALRDAPCPGDNPCPIHSVWVEARRVLIEGFAEVPVVQLHPQGALK